MSAPHGGRNSFGAVAACKRFGVHSAIRQTPQLRIQHRRRGGCRREPQCDSRGYRRRSGHNGGGCCPAAAAGADAGCTLCPADQYGRVRRGGHRGIESGGNIIPVQLTAHDTDGQAGLNIPNSLEREAAKEAVASVGSSGISSISVTHNAGQQAAMDLVRGAMSAGSQYLNAKMREVKINLKAGYQLLLISKE